MMRSFILVKMLNCLKQHLHVGWILASFFFCEFMDLDCVYNLGHMGWKKKSFYTHFAPPHPCAMLTKHFHLTQVCNTERGNGGVGTYSVAIMITISCFWHFPAQFVQGCRSINTQKKNEANIHGRLDRESLVNLTN